MKCTLCNSDLVNKVDDYYFVCSICNAYVKDHQHYISSENEILHYKKHNNDVNDPRYRNFTAPITQYILNNYSNKEIGLDYGCGTGPVISKQLIDKGFNVKLFDPYFYPDRDYLNHMYDFIFSCEVFEHFYQPRHEIEKLLKLLKPNGKLIIMTHLFNETIDFNNWYYRRDPTHVFIYTKLTIDYIARKYRLFAEEKSERLSILKKLPTTE